MGNSVKGLQDGPCVLLVYDRFSDARGNLFNNLSNPSASMLEVNEMVACPTFMSRMLDESLLNSNPPRVSHVRYNLSHSMSQCKYSANDVVYNIISIDHHSNGKIFSYVSLI